MKHEMQEPVEVIVRRVVTQNCPTLGVPAREELVRRIVNDWPATGTKEQQIAFLMREIEKVMS